LLFHDFLVASGQAVCQRETASGPLKVFENEQYRWFTLAGEAIQGAMDKTQPEKVIMPTIQAMLLFLLWPKGSQKVLNLGLGSAAIERALATQAGIEVTSVELESEVVLMAEQFFQFKPPAPVVHACADAFIKQSSECFDVILIDLFSQELHPAFFNSAQFWQNTAQRLTQDGQVFINLYPKDEKDLLEVLLLLKPLYQHMLMIELKDFKNIILVASQQSLSKINLENISQDSRYSRLTDNFALHLKKIFPLAPAKQGSLP